VTVPAIEGARTAVRRLRAADRRLGALIASVGPFELELRETASPFAALAEAIVYQQLTGKAAATIFGRVRALYPGRGFPAPQAVLRTPETALRGAGLSRGKVAALRDLASRVLEGTVPTLARLRRLDDEEVVARLTQVRGVGRWTAEMFLIFRLGRLDVLPVDDYGLRKGYALTYARRALPTRAELASAGERWRPYRTVATWYLWRRLDRERETAAGG
jgi:3-methyladenine DNA glycosylase/8-oxoguanine DNA glycosylase